MTGETKVILKNYIFVENCNKAYTILKRLCFITKAAMSKCKHVLLRRMKYMYILLHG
jgi:hypothetical protein